MSIPGDRSRELLARLHAHESRNLTAIADDFPIVWESASGAVVTDVDGNEYLDLTAAFGVAAAGHANPYVASAIADQAARLMHGMGDVHPTQVRSELLAALARRLPGDLNVSVLAASGSDAIETALKTAILATGRSRFAAFRNGYHGLSFGALSACGIEAFRAPFQAALGPAPLLLDYPRAGAISVRDAIAATAAALAGRDDLAAVVVEPIQGRGGCIVPPDGYLRELRALCDRLGLLLIVDEIFTGFGRTGSWFAIERDGIVPDLLCTGKALGSGFPIGVTTGTPAVMEAWPPSRGEALHTSTFLGNPMACAAALATLHEFERLDLPARAARLGVPMGARLEGLRALPFVADVRGRGLFWAVQLDTPQRARDAVVRALRAGVIALQAGPLGDAISLSPPLVIEERQLWRALDAFEAAVASARNGPA